jgi:acyl carrier protein
MSSAYDEVMAVVTDRIRRTVNEDWIQDFEISPQTRFDADLELESIEFVKIAEAIQDHYGSKLEIIAWLSGKSMEELIGFSVGALVDYIAAALASRKV